MKTTTVPSNPIITNSSPLLTRTRTRRTTTTTTTPTTPTTPTPNKEHPSASLSSNTASTKHEINNKNNGSNERYQIDINLASEIGRNLLSKIRSLQQTVQQQEQNIIILQSEKLDLQQNFKVLSDRLQSQCEIEERLNNEIRKLESSRQEHMSQIQALNQALARSHMEQARMIRQQTLMNQELELLKAVHESWAQNNKEKDVLNTMDEKSEVVITSSSSSSSFTSEQQHDLEDKTENDLNLYNDKEIQQQQQHLTIQELDKKNGNDNDDTSSSYKSNVSRKNSHDHLHQKHQSVAPKISMDFDFLKKEELVERQRSRTWTYKDLPSISNLEKIAHQQQQQEINEFKNNNNNSSSSSKNKDIIGNNKLTYHDFPLPPTSYSTTLNRSVSVGSMTSSSRYKQKDILITGSWMWKFTRNKTTVGISTERRHLRFVWLEPTIKTLFWKERDKMECPKSAHVKSFVVELSKDPKRVPNLIFQGEHREIKLQCTDMDTHSIWVQALENVFRLHSLRRHKRRSMLCFGESTTTTTDKPLRRPSRIFRHTSTIPLLRNISSLNRKGNQGHRDSGVGSSPTYCTDQSFYNNQQNCNNNNFEELDLISGKSGKKSQYFYDSKTEC
ncbi:hypothetical protein INT45_002387 [Circinella minor]|uniref:Pleckstrin homology domain-containing protein n=1 Tax=Circinella minor TaxID=1195481 RepID=A0A8H7RXP8_9FUNG|nr:hypothetical protein INT45_002387 [Circinella minor]